jgi:hypothetical protein
MSIRRRGPHSYQVRVGNLPARTVPRKADAERLEVDLRRRLSMGELYEEPPRTLGDEIAALLARLRAGRAPGDRTVEFNERSAEIWRAFEKRRISTLRRVEMEDFITARAVVHARSAKNELEFLKRALARGQGSGSASRSSRTFDSANQASPSAGTCSDGSGALRARRMVSGARQTVGARRRPDRCSPKRLVQLDG